MELRENDTFFFDLDRTLWNWDSLVIGAADLVDTLRSTGRDVKFHTDNTLLTREGYAQKLKDLGIRAEEQDVITTGYVAAQTLVERNVQKAYVAGASGLIEEFDREGIKIDQEAETAVVGFDRQFNYDKLKNLMKIAEKGGDILVCSSETTFRHDQGYRPHQGPFNRAINEIGETELIGKPSETFREVFRDYFSYYQGKSAFIGDRLADIETGNQLGMTTGAVLSGEIDEKTLRQSGEKQVPDYALTSLNKLRRRII